MPATNPSQAQKRLHVKFIGGRLCLDFVNTVSGREAHGGIIREKLASYEDLLDWSLCAGTLVGKPLRRLAQQAELHPPAATAVLARAHRLREALYRICLRITEPDADILRAELAIARANQHLTACDAGFEWTFPKRSEALDRPLWPIALSAAELLTSTDFARVGQCRGTDCRWLFVDTSRGRRRRWCDMQDCGNRAKVRRYRARRVSG